MWCFTQQHTRKIKPLSLKSVLASVRCPLPSTCLWSFIAQGFSKETLKNQRCFLSGVQETCGSVTDLPPWALFRAMKFMSSVLYTAGLNDNPQVHATGHSDGNWSPPRAPQGHVVCPSLYPQTLSFCPGPQPHFLFCTCFLLTRLLSISPQNYWMGLGGDSERKICMFYLNSEQIIFFLPLNVNFLLGYCSKLEIQWRCQQQQLRDVCIKYSLTNMDSCLWNL